VRVGISAEFLGVKLCGTATYTQHLLQGLAQGGGSHQYVPYLSHPRGLGLVPRAPHLTPRLVRPYASLVRLPFTLPAELLRRPVDVLHSQGWGPPWAPCPLVLTIHDIGWETFPHIYGPALRWRLSILVRASARRAVRVICSSRYTADDVMRRYGVPEAKIRVVYPGFAPSMTRVTDQAAVAGLKARYGIPGPYILYLGSIEPKKGVDKLIRAYAALRRRQAVSHHLVIAGKPLWLSRPILELPAALGVERDVLFLGQVPAEELPALYSGADAFAFLGLYEGFGYPPLEAMACGTPVLAARRTSLPEVVGDAGLLVDPEQADEVVQAMADLLGDPELRGELSRRGLQRARAFDPCAAAQQVAAVYEESVQPVRRAVLSGSSQT
jgi:glycosyltransferase involved in cell wall biosynthesis